MTGQIRIGRDSSIVEFFPIVYGQNLSAMRILVGTCSLFAAISLAAAPVLFEKDIRPILKAHCFQCHGEGGKEKGDLDVRLRRLLLEGGEHGPAIVAGQPGKSLLFQKVRDGKMPKDQK